MDEPTADPGVVLEERRPGYRRYRNLETGDRWEVHGVCDRRGDCLIGAIIDTPDGPIEIRSRRHLAALKRKHGRDRVDSELDVPVGRGFHGCCPLRVVAL